MSTLAVVEEILRETAVPMSVREIVERAGARLPSKSKTPTRSSRATCRWTSRRRARGSLFVRTSPGRYTLRALVPAGDRRAARGQQRSVERRRRARPQAALPPHATTAAPSPAATRPRRRLRRLIRRVRPSSGGYASWHAGPRPSSGDPTRGGPGPSLDRRDRRGGLRDLGDYTRILPSWLEQPGVLAWIDHDVQGRGRGFAMLGFYTEDAAAHRRRSSPTCSRSPCCRRTSATASARGCSIT